MLSDLDDDNVYFELLKGGMNKFVVYLIYCNLK